VLIELSIAWVVTLNVLAWLVIQFGLAWSFTRLASRCFNPRNAVARPKRWELEGRLYERAFGIRLWKDRLPDASRLFAGGFPKASLRTSSPEFLERFLLETWRGELVHWLALLAIPIFCVWNPWWGVAVNAAVAVALNVPCILALRYNRIRLARLLRRR
jgi:glycosyl-4,4'-diaponeurosporenoate acyltransferase